MTMIRTLLFSVLFILLVAVSMDAYLTSVSHFRWQSNPGYSSVFKKTIDCLTSFDSLDWLYGYDYRPLSDSLTRGASTKAEKATRIYRYLTQNVTYSLENWVPYRCLTEGKGICSAISYAFVKLAREAGIEAYTVPGYCVSQDETFQDMNHMWVLWRDEDGWQLGDPTWDLGEDRLKYFKMAPKEMIKRHYPFSRDYQMLDEPLSFSQWKTMLDTGEVEEIPPKANSFDRILGKIGFIGSYLKEKRYFCE